MSDYHLVDPRTGVRHALTASKAGLPISPGAVSFAFQASQGSLRSLTDLLHHIGLLHRGRAHLRVWKDAATAVREVRRKVELPPPLQLLLEPDALPTSQWERITELWRISSSPWSAISRGI